MALVAIYFTYQTITQQSITTENQRRERELQTLRDVIRVVADLRLAIMNMNTVLAPPLRAQLAATLTLISWDLPAVRRLTQVKLGEAAQDWTAAQGVADEALAELENATNPWSVVTSLARGRSSSRSLKLWGVRNGLAIITAGVALAGAAYLGSLNLNKHGHFHCLGFGNGGAALARSCANGGIGSWVAERAAWQIPVAIVIASLGLGAAVALARR